VIEARLADIVSVRFTVESDNWVNKKKIKSKRYIYFGILHYIKSLVI
jgi:hypothetical protein